MTEQEQFQKAFEKLHASPEVLTEVMEMADSNKGMKKRFKMAKVAVAGLALVLMGTTGFAASKIAGYYATSNTSNDITQYEKVLSKADTLDFECNIPKSFKNGYVFESGNLGNVAAVDENNRPMKKAKIWSIDYSKKGAENISLGIQPQMEKNEENVFEDERRTINGVDVLYFEVTYKFVPDDYVMTEEDKENEKKLDYIFSRGADKVEVKQCHSISFVKDGSDYTMYGYNSKLSVDEWFMMAEELIN